MRNIRNYRNIIKSHDEKIITSYEIENIINITL